MSVKKFRFVSPGIFINEIDNSQLPQEAGPIGPVIIGRTERGPGMRPVQVNSFSEFVEIFGNPIAGGKGGDIWRNGNYTAPTYAAYAAQAWLRNATPCTVVRLLGTKHTDATGTSAAEGAAGWSTAGTSATGGGAYGLFIAPFDPDVGYTSSSDVLNAALAAVIYVDGKHDIGLSGTGVDGGAVIGTTATDTFGTGQWTISNGANYGFKIHIGGKTKIINFDRNSKKFIRNVLNTNPTMVNENATANTEKYFLGETYERHLEDLVKAADDTSKAAGRSIGLLMALESGTSTVLDKNEMNIEAQSPQTSWVFSQHIGSNDDHYINAATGEYANDVAKLFKFHGLSDGAWSSRNLKLSIMDIKAGDDYNPYGTFTVALRKVEDSDNSPRFAERFTGCNLNPNSPDYIARKIGDMWTDWDDAESRYRTYGEYPNLSKFIRVQVASDVEAGADSSLVPFGFYGPAVPRPVRCSSDAEADMAALALVDAAKSPQAEPSADYFGVSWGSNLSADATALSHAATSGQLDSPFFKDATDTANPNINLVWPAMTARSSSTTGNLSNGKDAFFGANSNKSGATTFDEAFADLVKPYSENHSLGQALTSSGDINTIPQLQSDGIYDDDTDDFTNAEAGGSGAAAEYATGTHTFSGIPDADGTVIIISTDGTSVTYTAKAAADLFNNQFAQGASATEAANSLELAIEHASGHNGSIKVENNGSGGLSLTQSVAGAAGNTTITNTLTLASSSGFANGVTGTRTHSTAQAAGDWLGKGIVPAFSLDDLVLQDTTTSGVSAKSKQHADWKPGARYSGASISVRGRDSSDYYDADGNTTSGDADEGTFKDVLEHGFNRFTLPLVGGFDGLDIKEKEPFRNTRLDDNAAVTTNYAYNSVKRAIDAVADPEVVEMNLAVAPGITNASLTTHLINTCEARADALAIIDLESDYRPSTENTDAESSRVPDVDLAVSTLKARGINSSYGCAYFPWVQIRDSISDSVLWTPPSVVALGTMASSQRKSELWFAPAGFNRGGLTEGSAGLSVIQARQRLTSKDRDKLYEANINPIATFPSEGLVIFGQKTLQVTPSALDRINVRRLLIYLKKEVSKISAGVLFDNNVPATWHRFTSQVTPLLASVKSRFGLSDFKVILDETTTTPDLIDRNVMYAKIMLKPARAIEYIAIDFVITNTGASFDD